MGPQNRINELWGAGRYAEAIPLAEQELRAAEQRLGSSHPGIRGALAQLANLHFARGNHEEAIMLLRRHLEISQNAFGPKHRETDESRQYLMGILLGAGRQNEATSLMRDSNK